MEQTFCEALNPQPPLDTSKIVQTIRGTTDDERLWVGYDLNGTRNTRIFCPYEVGSRIPNQVTAIKTVKIDACWYWEVTIDVSLQTVPKTCPNCDNQWHPIIGCIECGLSPQDFY